MKRIIFLFHLITLLSFGILHATDYYVNASTGNNTTGNGSSGSPWKTITYALGQISGSGHTLYVSAGTYNTALGETFPILMEDGVSIVGEGIDVSVIDAGGTNTVIRCVSIVDGTTKIEGFTVKGAGTVSPAAGFYVSAGSALKITNNKVTANTGYGLYVVNSFPSVINNAFSANSDDGIYISDASPMITGNSITGSSDGNGIYVYGSSSSPRILNNIIVKNVLNGIYCYSSSPKIFNNTISENLESGVYISSASPDSVFNNILAMNGYYGIEESDASCDPGKLWYNLFFANASGLYRNEGTTDYFSVIFLNADVTEAKNNISGDPLFPDRATGDYHESVGSPAVDGGDPNFGFGNEPAPNGGRINIGAYGNTAAAALTNSPPPLPSALYVSTFGSNATGDGSSGNPWKTITFALSQITASGHTVHVSDGTYDTALGESFPIFVKDGVSLVGSGKDGCFIDAAGANTSVLKCVSILDTSVRIEGFTVTGGNLTYPASLAGSGIFISAGSYVKIITNKITDNHTVHHPWRSSMGEGIYIENSSPVILDNIISDNSGDFAQGFGIYIGNSSPLIEGNTFSGNTGWTGAYEDGSSLEIAGSLSFPRVINNIISGSGEHGIRCSQSSHPRILNNVIFGSADDGIQIESANPVIINNTISDNGRHGIYNASAIVDTLLNNIISYNTSYGIYESGTSSDPGKAWYNLFYSNGMGVYRDEGATDYYTASSLNSSVAECKNNLSGDPMFVNKVLEDYHLQLGSPAMDAGDPNCPLDPDGTGADIGSYSYFQTEFPPAAPKDLSAISGDGQVELHWTCNTEPDFLRYRIYAGVTTAPTTQVDSIDGISSGMKIVTGLSNGSRHYFRMTAVDSTLMQSGYSNEATAVPNSPRSLDSLALVTLYDSTGGDGWTNKTNWKSTNPIDTWYGVNMSNGRVNYLDLTDNHLTGRLPSSIGDLSALENLKLGSNIIMGSIPASVGDLVALEELYIHGNQFTGSIPSSIGNLSNLRILYLQLNYLTGSIPHEIGNLSQVQLITVSGNNLSGSIPSEIGNLANLTALYLNGNQFTGTIPVSLGNLTGLQYLTLSDNQLTGSIPAELGTLMQLQWLWLASNQLSGSIPSEIGNLNLLTQLYLDHNDFIGNVPDLSGLTALTDLRINSNHLSGLQDLNSISSLENLIVDNNQFTFEDIEPNIGAPSSTFTYSPQDSVGVYKDTTVDAGSVLDLTITVGGTSNQYQWYKNGSIIDGANSATYSIPLVTSADSATYHCRITNTVATALTLYSRTFKVHLYPPLFAELPAELTGLYLSSVAWGDYDNDNDLDLIVTGYDGTNRYTHLYKNDAGSFVSQSVGLDQVFRDGTASWGDYDHDGDLDLLLTGGFNAKIYQNNGGTFSDIQADIYAGDAQHCSSAWGDYDNDGDLDFIMTGSTATRIYRNNDGVFADISAGLASSFEGATAWGDYDNDGDLDIVLAGGLSGSEITKIYRNDAGVFTDINAIITGIRNGTLAWGDYDADGDLDLVVAGQYGNPINMISTIYRNDAGSFTDINAGFSVSDDGSVAFGDYDNDGDHDVLMTGSLNTDIFRNDSGIFVPITQDIPGVSFGSAQWGDYDNDGDLDIAISGQSSTGYVTKIYRNDSPVSNTVPTAPNGLTAVLAGNMVTFNWSKSTDEQTAQNGLTYNLSIGTTPGGCDIVSPMANSTTGKRKVVQSGNAGHHTGWIIKDLPQSVYYWSVQAIDNVFAGSEFSTEQSFFNIDNRKRDSLALVTFYDSTGGDNWINKTNWKSSNPIDTWYGVTMNEGRVNSLAPHANNLTGTIPSAIANLTALEYLYLNDNQLTGSIPIHVFSLSGLISLQLQNNQFSGSIPSQIGNLSALTYFDLSGNQLSGTIPSELGNLTQLQDLYLDYNQLSGSLPSEIGNLTALTHLSISSNNLSGEIPESVGNLGNIQEIALPANSLSGTIPSAIWTLSSLHSLNLSSNPFQAGPLDPAVGNLVDLNELILSSTNRTALPSEVGNLINLGFLNLSNNDITGQIPSSMGNLRNLYQLNLDHNHFSGSIPNEFGRLQNLLFCYLSFNDLEGEADSLQNLGNLQTLSLHNNRITGLPSLSGLIDLNSLLVSENALTFEDIEPNIGGPNVEFTYSPQDSTGRHIDTTVVPGESITFTASVGGANNLYQWFFNGGEIFTATGTAFTISNASASEHNGTYTCRVTNSVATALTLSTKSIFLSVQMPPRYLDSLALVELYDSTGGDNWTNKTNWKSSNPIDTWYGVTVVNNRVEQLWLVENSLSGHIPASIGNLTALTHLSLRPNNLNGNIGGLIPSTIGNLTVLVVLQLSHNQLTGSIPATIGNLSKVEILTLDNNLLSGSIPNEIGNLRKVQHLNLSANQLSGSIPDIFSTMDSLKDLYMSGNHLSGSIPNSIGDLTELVELELSYNQLTGTIPMTMSNLTQLQHLYLRDNQLSGQIPSFFGNFVQLYHLYLTSNQFSGAIPDEIGNMSSLTELNIETNLISGQIPATLGNLSQLQALELGHNQLSGSIPEVIGNLLQLKWIVLDHNQLSGSVPSSIENLGNLLWLKLNDNQLTGLPDLTSLDSLQNLHIENNKLTFEDIEPQFGKSYSVFTYSPQDSVGTYSTLTMLQGSSNALTVTVGGSHNQYQWMKNGVDIPDATSNEYNNLYWDVPDSGNYVCRITNTVATELTLYSRHTRVIVYPMPTMPGNLVAVPVTSSRIDLSWTASANATKYFISRSLISGSGFNVIDSVNVPATSYSSTGLSVNTTYYYRIYAANQYGGTSSNSNEVSATTLGLAPSLGTPNVSNPSPVPGAAVTITVTVAGTSPTVKLFYGKTTQSEGDSLAMTFNGTNYSGTIPGASVTQEGVWFRMRAQNTGGIDYYPGTTSKANISVTINDMTSIWDNSYFYGGIPAEQYFSIAMSMEGSLSLTDLWGTQTLEEGIPTNWRAWDFNRTSQAFADVTSLSGDKAYFLFHREGSAQEIFNSVTSKKTNDPLMFDNFLLRPGWNAVPWPFTFPANIYIKDTNQDSIGSLWKLWGNSGWEQVTECSAFCGYMIYNKTAGDVRLGNVISWTMMATKPMIDQSGWRLRLIAESGSYRDAFNFVGVSRDFATMSEPEPLTIGKSVTLNFKHNEQNLSSDIRSDAEDGHVWDLSVLNTSGNDRAVLKWESGALPADLHIRLIDVSNNKILRLDETIHEYEFRTHRHNIFKLIAGNAEFVEREALRIKATLPDEFGLSQNYPNPFNPSTTIKFDVARSGQVKLKVYNILGQEIVTLVDGYFETGKDYWINWDGKDALGRSVASGVYIYQLEAGNCLKARKMLLIK